MHDVFILVTLSTIAFFTSLVTAILGMGGGMLLIAALPSLLPANALIPVHGAVQFSSNFSRFVFGYRQTLVKPLMLFIVGALIGSALGGHMLGQLDIRYIPLFLSLFIMVVLWAPIDVLLRKIPGKYFSLGIVQTALSLYVGVTGPVSTSVLLKEGYRTDQVIVTNAAFLSVLNGCKIIVFILIGFSFYHYLLPIILMSLGAFLGSFAGTKWRRVVKESLGRAILKTVITLLCIKNILVFLFF